MKKGITAVFFVGYMYFKSLYNSNVYSILTYKISIELGEPQMPEFGEHPDNLRKEITLLAIKASRVISLAAP